MPLRTLLGATLLLAACETDPVLPPPGGGPGGTGAPGTSGASTGGEATATSGATTTGGEVQDPGTSAGTTGASGDTASGSPTDGTTGAELPVDAGPPPSTTEDAGVLMPVDTASDDPRAPLQGDYLVRFTTVASTMQAQLGKVRVESVGYGVMRVVLSEGALVASERLCHSFNEQLEGNGKVSSSVSPAVWPNLTPVQRTLEVDMAAGSWSSNGGMRRHGWRESAAEMPRDPVAQADLFLDPDEDGRPGVATRVQGEVVILLTIKADCQYDVVSWSETQYVGGTLSPEGLLQGANTEALGSDVFALNAEKLGGSAPCAVADINEQAGATTERDDIQLARVAEQWLADPAACPSVEEFEAALP